MSAPQTLEPRNAPGRWIGSRGSGQARGAVIHSSAQVATVPERQFQRDSTASAFVRSCATRRPVKLLQRTASAASRDNKSFPNRWSRLGHQEPKDRCTKQGRPGRPAPNLHGLRSLYYETNSDSERRLSPFEVGLGALGKLAFGGSNFAHDLHTG